MDMAMKACLNSSHSSFPVTSRVRRGQVRCAAPCRPYRRWQADGADSGSRACGGSGRAVYPGLLEVAEEEEERRPFPSSPERGADQRPCRRRTDF